MRILLYLVGVSTLRPSVISDELEGTRIVHCFVVSSNLVVGVIIDSLFKRVFVLFYDMRKTSVKEE